VKSAMSAKSKYLDQVSPRKVFHDVGMSIILSPILRLDLINYASIPSPHDSCAG
jgi:hypothetical protein